jgi:hypothetical protein
MAAAESLAFSGPRSLPRLPDRILKTLGDAGRYVAALPEKVQQRAEWQVSVEMLMSAAEGSLTLSGHLSTSSQRR